MGKEIIELLNEFNSGNYKETRSSYEKLREHFQSELNKIEFTKLEFNNYRDCYNKLGQIFSSNGVIGNICRYILHYKKGEGNSLNAEWAYKEKGNYHYKNAYCTQEVYVKCENRKYYLKYRKLVLEK